MDILSYKLGQNSIEPDKPDQTKTVDPTTSQQVVRPDTGYELASVTVNAVTSSIDSNIQAENIKKDVSILGVTGTLEEGQEGIYKVASIQEMSNLDNVEEGDICLVYDSQYKAVIPNLNFNVFQFPDSVTLSQAVQQSNAYFQMVDESEGYVSVDFSIYEGAEISGFVELDGNFQEFNITYTTSDNITFTKSSATGEGIITGNIVTLPKEIYLSEPNSEVGSFIKVEQPEFAGIFQYDGSNWNNLNIGLDVTTNDIFAGIKAYSNNGILTGTLGNTVSSNLKYIDNLGKLYGISQIYYDTLTPTVTPANSNQFYLGGTCIVIPVKTDGTPLLDTSNATSMTGMFERCKSLVSIPILNTSNVTNMSSMFFSCSSLQEVPLLDTSRVTVMEGMFRSCPNLSDKSLNNILLMCKNSAITISNNKNLSYLGFKAQNYPASKIQTLSNYQAFINAGWSIGY